MCVADVRAQEINVCWQKCKHFVCIFNKRTKNNASYYSENYQKHVQYKEYTKTYKLSTNLTV